METLLNQIRQELQDNSDEKTLSLSNHFFKENEQAKVYGVGMKLISPMAKSYLPTVKAMPKQQFFSLCEELWSSGYLEEAVIACEWTDAMHKQQEPADFEIFEGWVRDYVDNWAACDTLCNHTIGEFVMKYPDYISRLKEWALSDNRWMRRAVAVTLIIPARKGMFLNDIFQIATLLLEDKDHMVQKGYGWMLKAASEAYQKEVFDYVVSRKTAMPRTALRYAIEKMPPELRAEAMKK